MRGHGLVHKRMRKGSLLLLDTATRHGLECGVESPIVLSHLAKIYQLLLDAARLYILDVH